MARPRIRTGPKDAWETWPKDCPGKGCTKRTRPPHTLSAKFPGTVPAVNHGGWCDACRRKANGKDAKVDTRSYTTDPAVKAQREAELLEWRRKFEADRRARGIPREGILFEGEKNIEPKFVLEPQPKIEDREPGTCRQGHPFDVVDAGGRRRCTICMRENGTHAKRAARLADPTGEHGYCPQGHALILDSHGKPLCRPCRNERKREWRERKRAEKAAEIDRALHGQADDEAA